MMETELTPVMSVFMIIMDLHGCKLEQTLMGKQQMTLVVTQFPCLLTGQEWLLGHIIMMQVDLTPVMSVFMIIMDLLGFKLEQTLMGKRQMIEVAALFLCLLTDQG